MTKMAGIWHQVAQRVGGLQGTLGMGRHLHEVDIHVQQSRVAHSAGLGKSLLQHLHDFNGVGTVGGNALRNIPHGPWRAVHQRIGSKRHNI